MELEEEVSKNILLEIIKEVGKLGEGELATPYPTRDFSFRCASFIDNTSCFIREGEIVIFEADLHFIPLSDPKAIEKTSKIIRESCRKAILRKAFLQKLEEE